MEISEIDLSSISESSVFISLRHEDIPHVRGLNKLLTSLKCTTYWMDDFQEGEWQKQIYEKIDKSDYLLIYISYQKEKTKFERWWSVISDKLRRYVFRSGNENPNDWIKHEYEVFTGKKGTDNVIVYLEAGAANPPFLAEQQFNSFSNALSDIRATWDKLKGRKIRKGEARKAVLAMLKEKGVDLGQADEFFDFFGIHGLNSLWRYFVFRLRAALLWVPAATAILFLSASGYVAAQLTADKTIYQPEITPTPILINKSGREACNEIGLVCASVSQRKVSVGILTKNEFYGYTTPSCESKVRRSDVCPRTFGTDFEMSDVYHVKSILSKSPNELTGPQRYCLTNPVWTAANCIDPLGK